MKVIRPFEFFVLNEIYIFMSILFIKVFIGESKNIRRVDAATANK